MAKCNTDEQKCQNGGLSIEAIYGPQGAHPWQTTVQQCEQLFLTQFNEMHPQLIEDIEKQATRHLMRGDQNMYPMIMTFAQIFQSFLSEMKCGGLILVLYYLPSHTWYNFLSEIQENLLNQAMSTQIHFHQLKSGIHFEYAKCMIQVLLKDTFLCHYAVNICVDTRILNLYGYENWAVKHEIVKRYKNNTLMKPLASLLKNGGCRMTPKEQHLCLKLVDVLFKEIPQCVLSEQVNAMIINPETHWDSGFLSLHTLSAINTNQTHNLPTSLAEYSAFYEPQKQTSNKMPLNSPIGIVAFIFSKVVDSVQLGTLFLVLSLDYPEFANIFDIFVKYKHDTTKITQIIFGEMDEGWKKLKWNGKNQYLSMDEFIWNGELFKQTVNTIQSQEYYTCQRQQCNATNFMQHIIHQPSFITRGPFSIAQDVMTKSLVITTQPQSVHEWRLFFAKRNLFWQQSNQNPQSYEEQQYLCLQVLTNMNYFQTKNNDEIIQIMHKMQNTSNIPNVSFMHDPHFLHDLIIELIFLKKVKCKCDEKENAMNDILSNDDTVMERKKKILRIVGKVTTV